MNKYNHFSRFIPFLLYSAFSTCVSAINSPRDISVISLGDWGSASLGGYHLRNAENTASAMSAYVEEYNPKLILNTGDNFYYCGIQNTSDPQISEDYIDLFGNISLPWYNA